jgi:hypothetical protein
MTAQQLKVPENVNPPTSTIRRLRPMSPSRLVKGSTRPATSAGSPMHSPIWL